jgi:AraC-like DNA-binding protein
MKRDRRDLRDARESQARSGSDIVLALKNDAVMVRTDTLRNFRELTAILGGDAIALLHRNQIDPSLLEGCEGMIPHMRMVQLLEHASAELACPDFGMRLAAVQAAHGATKMLGPLDVAMRNSPTLGEAFKYCADHVHAYSSSAQLCFEKLPDDPRAFMMIDILVAGLLQQRQASEYALALTQHAIHAISGGQARAREVWLTHEPLAPLATYRAHFNATVRFGQSMNGLFFDEQDFHLPVPNTDPQLYEIATSFIDQRFPAAATSLSTRVRILIARLLFQGQCTHEHVASALALHPRTLQRRLREEGESFEGIKDSVRREIALRYLQQPNVSLARVTEILGYSETSVLSRSCHRWFCASPRELRNGLHRLTAAVLSGRGSTASSSDPASARASGALLGSMGA